VLAAACSFGCGGASSPSATADDALASDATPEDDAGDASGDVAPDTQSLDLTLMGGVASRPLRLPVGTATVGYSPGQGPKTPYAESYPGTTAAHTELTAKAMVIRQGDKAIALVRTDTIGVWQDIIRDAQVRLRELGHPALADGLIVAATHTHRSGGRIFDHFIGEIAVGPFLEGFYPRIRGAIVDAVIEASEAAVPVRVGHGAIQVPSLHKDRRCENADLQDDTMGLIKLETSDGDLLGVVVNYAMHGTVIGSDEPVLSTDAPGAIEDGIEAALADPAMVLYLQSWAGDMAPVTPTSHFTDAGHDLRDSYRSLRAIAAEAAALVVPAVATLDTRDDIDIDIVSTHVPFDNALINPDGSFDAYPFGGIYCMASTENCGPDAAPYAPEELSCFGVPEEYTVSWTLMTAARIGDLGLITLPGEPLTSIGTELRSRALEDSALGDVFVIGYAQSYLAYLLHPDDFFMGGYEGASCLMGPGFGQYLVESGVALSRHLADRDAPLHAPAAALETPDASLDYDDLPWEDAEGTAEITQQPVDVEGVWEMTWRGGDPAVDAPRVTVQRQIDGAWVPATYPSGRIIDSRGPEIELSLTTEPAYSEAMHRDSRTFLWTARLPSAFAVPAAEALSGQLRLVVEGTRPEPYSLTSEPFQG